MLNSMELSVADHVQHIVEAENKTASFKSDIDNE